MEVKYNVCGPRRKEMVQAVSEALGGSKARYLGLPSCAYQVGAFEITREGTLIFDDRTEGKMVEKVRQCLAQAGFAAGETDGKQNESPQAEQTEKSADAPSGTAADADTADENAASGGTEPGASSEPAAPALDGLTVILPRAVFTTAALDNLDRLLESKGSLIRKAFGIEEAVYTLTDDRLTFAWLTGDITPEKAKACRDFIGRLCEMAKRQKRVTARVRAVTNEKYAFRCFLLRLGLIGAEYKTTRKILLRNLSGSAAWRDGHRKEVSGDEVSG